MVGIGRVFPPYVIVQHAAVGILMNMRLVQIHVIALDGVGDAADEDHSAVWIQLFDDSHMGQGIVQLAVSVEIPRVIEKHEIAWTDVRSSMKGAMLPHVVVDEPDAVSLRIIESSTIEIDAVLQEDGTGHPCTVIGDTFALACNSPCSDQPGCRLNDG